MGFCPIGWCGHVGVGRYDRDGAMYKACNGQPSTLEMAFTVIGTVIGVALLALIFWNAATESALRLRLDYRRCAPIKNGKSRLACYDETIRQGLRPVKDVHRMTFGEILSNN
jgi:hypothetical protein